MQEPQTLIDAALQGDGRSWQELVERYGPLVWSVGRDCGLVHQDREDLAQTVFTILLRQLPHLRDRSAITGWLVVTAKREAWRMSARARKAPTSSDEILAMQGQNHERETEQYEREQAVREAVAKLDRRCQELLQALFGQGETPSYEAIAKRLGIRPNSVGPTRRRCLEKAFQHLDEDHGVLFSTKKT